jgi:hypothetical protein
MRRRSDDSEGRVVNYLSPAVSDCSRGESYRESGELRGLWISVIPVSGQRETREHRLRIGEGVKDAEATG